jgi:hypothetical protein
VSENGGGLALDLERHQYSFDGKRVGGVSEILTGLGIVDRSWFTEFACARGSAVHAAIEYLLHGRLDCRSLDERIKGYVEAAVAFIDAAGIYRSPQLVIERPVWHPVWRFAGMPDLIAEAFGELSLIDWKTGGASFAGLQTAAYDDAYRFDKPTVKPLRRMAVQLKSDGTFKKTDLRDARDYTDFQACCLIYNKYVLPRRIRGTDDDDGN